jgi:hypothetical protein
MASHLETDAIYEAKVAAIMEPYKKAGISTVNCNLQGIICFIFPKDFAKINKFLHHLIREGILPQLITQAREKGIISGASSLNPAAILDLNTWLRTKEGQAAIKEEYDMMKLKRKAAKRLHREISSVGEEVQRKVVDDDVALNAGKRARMLDTEETNC